MIKQKKLPIGIQSFSRMIEGDFLYIDKTKYILDLIESGDCYFLSRPRRFGKSLLLSTLHEIFSGNRELFKSLYIDQTDYDWVEHPVIHVSFSSMNSTSAENLRKDLEWNLLELAKKHGIDVSNAPSLQTKLTTLIKQLSAKNRVVILIDEYDYPLINNINNLELVESCRKVLHDFFVVLKDLGDYLTFIFITGVTKFSKTSIFSGLNNLNDLTLSKKAGVLLGYTQEELKTHFHTYIDTIAKKQLVPEEHILEDMRSWYNGYQFVEEDTPKEKETLKVYNPFSVLFFLSNKKLLNYWADTGTPSFLVQLIQTQQYPISEIEGSEVNIEETKSYDIDKIKLIPLLWQTGYLTIDTYNPETQNYKLKYPNEEVKVSFFNYFMSSLTNTDIALLKNNVVQLTHALKNNDLTLFFKALGIFFAEIPYTMQLALEKYYQTIFYIILKLIGTQVHAEVVTNDGRIDAVIETASTIYLLEFKLNEPAEIALKQIEEKKYYQKYQHKGKSIVLIGAQFDTELRNIKEWVSRKLPQEMH